MAIAPSGPYLLSGRDVFKFRASSLATSSVIDVPRLCSREDRLAVILDEGGLMLEHGEAEATDRWLQRAKDLLTRNGDARIAEGLSLLAFEPTPEAVAELNACISEPHRGHGFEDRLRAFGALSEPEATRAP